MDKLLNGIELMGLGIFMLVVHYKPNVFPKISTKIKNSKFPNIAMIMGYIGLVLGLFRLILHR